MKRYTQEELAEVLRLHQLWMVNEEDGVRAYLSGAYLSGADLSGADLSGADLYGANLFGADLSGANLYGAYLSGANLYGADLSGADLSGADLSGADLYWANLYGADLSGADLSGADLSGADLSGANLYGADISGANLYGANGVPNILCVGPIGSRCAYATYWIDEDRVQCGCWRDYRGGSVDEFEERVREVHTGKHLAEYLAAITLFRAIREAQPTKGEATQTEQVSE
jgi:hypothetical protein